MALGVAALLSVLSITSGFQREFRDKVLGVNSHVLVLRYGVDFDEYREVIAQVSELPEVVGAGPFLINEMMLAKGEGLSGVLVKGIDPAQMRDVLDLPGQILSGTLDGLRVRGAPVRPSDLDQPPREDGELDRYLQQMRLSDLDARESEASDSEETLGARDNPHSTPEAASPEMPSLADVEAALRALEADTQDPFSGIDAEMEQRMLQSELAEIEREESGIDALPGIVIGIGLARELGIGIGDRVKVISPLTGLDIGSFAPRARTPRSIDFRVVAIFEAGFQEYDTRLVYVDLYEAQRFYNNGDSVTGVEIRLADLELADEVARTLEEQLGAPFHTLDWATLNHNLFTALRIQKVMLSLVIATIIFVAAFNVIATLIMIVLEKKREVSILKAMGARDRTILGIFMLQGTVIGVVGTAIGLTVGGAVVGYLDRYRFPLDPKVYLIDHLPVVVSPWEFATTVLVALTICITATAIPSIWAARMRPAEGVRYE